MNSSDMRQLGIPIVRMGTVSSTMDSVRRLATLGAAEGVAVIAATQTRGRGRADRSWYSPAGSGLYCSILLRPGIPLDRFQSFSIAAGLALCDALDPDGRLLLRLKWPNDILFDDRKLAGILVTTVVAGQNVESAVLGFGINLLPDPARADTAVSLADISEEALLTIDELFPMIAKEISNRYTAILQNDLATALIGWSTRLAWLNQTVSIQDGDARRTGYLRGIDEHGALILETTSGVITIAVGELVRGPRPNSENDISEMAV